MRTRQGVPRRRSVAATVALTPASLSPAHAASPTPAHAAASSTGDTLTLNGVRHGPHTVTLITGDSVKLTPVGGRYSIDPQPEPPQRPEPDTAEPDPTRTTSPMTSRCPTDATSHVDHRHRRRDI